MLRVLPLLVGLLGLALLVRAQLGPEGGGGDASGHYTDHLRHEGEALILTGQGLAVYRAPYGGLIGRAGLDPIHSGLFPGRTAPYPPLGILAHWPWAVSERSGLLSAPAAHRGTVWMWTLAALAAGAVVVLLVRSLPLPAQLWAVVLAVPLLVGIGINGFLDAGYLLCGALACLAVQRRAPLLALWLLALAAALHFRAVVFLPLAAVLLWELRGRLPVALAAGVLVIPTLVAAAALSGTLDTIPPHSPVHYSHLRLPLVCLFAISAALAVYLWRQPVHASTRALAAATVVAAFALAVNERSHGWWHAGALLGPGLVLAGREESSVRTWALVGGWTIAGSFLAYRHPWSVFWTWVPLALGGL